MTTPADRREGTRLFAPNAGAARMASCRADVVSVFRSEP